jgi:biopolymer transport protein ExbD
MRRHGPGSIDFDLNLAPIIDVFTVLITFLLASASFLSVSLFDAGFTQVEQVGDVNPPPITISLTIKGAEAFDLEVKGKTNLKESFRDLASVTEQLQSLQGKYPKVESLTLSASDDVPYESVVQAMEKIRAVMPGIILGGF